MKANNKFLFAILFLTTVFSCQKDKQNINNAAGVTASQTNTTLTLNDAQAWVNNQSSSGQLSTQSTKSNFNLSRLSIPWEKAQSNTNKSGNYWLISLPGQPTYNNVKIGYRKLAVMRDSIGKIQARILEIIPDIFYIQKKQKATTADFTGRIFIYDQSYNLLGGRILAGGKQIGAIKAKTASTTIITTTAKLRTDMVRVIESCEWYDSGYVNSEGEAVITSEQVCDTMIYDDGGGSGGSGGSRFDGGSGDYAGGGGGGGGTISSAPAVVNLPGEDGQKVNPRSYMDCFGNIPDAGSTMKVTMYVQEPFPGTSFAIGPNSVGHTAISLTKSNGSSTITQTLAFYPDASGYSKLNAPSKLEDNTGISYNVSITYSVDAQQFANLINYISNPPPTYDLNSFNCTSFAISACQYAGIQTPSASSVVGINGATMSLEYADTPAGLGDSIENLKGQSNVNTNGGSVPPSKGPCN